MSGFGKVISLQRAGVTSQLMTDKNVHVIRSLKKKKNFCLMLTQNVFTRSGASQVPEAYLSSKHIILSTELQLRQLQG